MPRRPDSAQLDLTEIFRRVQSQMLADLAVGNLFEHASSAGAATEHRWIQLFARYLPKRYRCAPVFVIDSSGRRSRQIDIGIFDNLYSPLLFPHEAGLHIPAESVYAVFEVKPTFSRQWLRDAAQKAASVRVLHRTSAPIVTSSGRRHAIRPRPILAGLLATGTVWNQDHFAKNTKESLTLLTGNQRLDLGCSLQYGAFEQFDLRASRYTHVSHPEEALIFFMLRLLDRLQQTGTTPAADLMQYARSLRSFNTEPPQ